MTRKSLLHSRPVIASITLPLWLLLGFGLALMIVNQVTPYLQRVGDDLCTNFCVDPSGPVERALNRLYDPLTHPISLLGIWLCVSVVLVASTQSLRSHARLPDRPRRKTTIWVIVLFAALGAMLTLRFIEVSNPLLLGTLWMSTTTLFLAGTLCRPVRRE